MIKSKIIPRGIKLQEISASQELDKKDIDLANFTAENINHKKDIWQKILFKVRFLNSKKLAYLRVFRNIYEAFASYFIIYLRSLIFINEDPIIC